MKVLIKVGNPLDRNRDVIVTVCKPAHSIHHTNRGTNTNYFNLIDTGGFKDICKLGSIKSAEAFFGDHLVLWHWRKFLNNFITPGAGYTMRGENFELFVVFIM